MLQQGALTQQTKELLDALVQQHLAHNENNPAQSLATLSSVGSLSDELKTLGVAEVDASLAHLPSTATRIPDSTQAGLASAAKNFPSAAERFRVVRMHAKGGIGQVSVALDDELSREVALKELQPRFADDPGSRNRFVLEAEVTGGLEHPGVVPVYGLGHYADGRPFYAMRFIRGDSLQDATETFHRTMSRDPGQVGYELELRKLLRRFIDVCDALEYAHSRGVLHRDLKPGNIMLGRYGETLVVDWGLAKVGTEQRESELRAAESTLQPSSADDSAPTRMGSTIGTPGYMSPEQAAGNIDQLGAASDVYSLGATLYHVLSGKPPFGGADVGVILSAVQSGAFKKPREVNPRIAKSLEAICLKAMAREPQQRYESARALAEDIERHLADEPTHARPDSAVQRIQRWTRRHRGFTWAAAAGLLLVSAVSALAFFAVSAERDEARTQRDRAVVSEEQAKQSAEEADEARALAERQEQRAERVAYNSTLSEAGRLLGTDPMMARSLLENKDRCPPALRDFLWHAMHLQTVREERAVPLELLNCFVMSFSPAGDVLTFGGMTNKVEIRDAVTGDLVDTLQTDLDKVDEFHFSHDGKSLAVVQWQEGSPQEAASGTEVMTVEVWDLGSRQRTAKRQRSQRRGEMTSSADTGFVSHEVISELDYSHSHPKYLRTNHIPANEYGEQQSRWYQWTAFNLESGVETKKYLLPSEGTNVIGEIKSGPPVLSCFCEREGEQFFWTHHVDTQQTKLFPQGREELDTEYFSLMADKAEASYFCLDITQMFENIRSVHDFETASFMANVSYRDLDLQRGSPRRVVELGQFPSGMFIEFQRLRFAVVDRQKTRLAMLLDRRPLVQVAELDDPTHIYRIPAHRGDVLNIDLSSDGARIATVGLDEFLRLWNLDEICTPREGTVPVVENPGRVLLANGQDEFVVLALGPDMQSGEEATPVPQENTEEPADPLLYQLERIRLSDGASLATQDFFNPPKRNIIQRAGFAGAINMINEVVVNSLASMFSVHPVSTIGTEVVFSDDGERLVMATNDRLLTFNMKTGTGDELWGPFYPDFKERQDLRDIAVSDDLKFFATLVGGEQPVRVYDFESRELYWEVPPPEVEAIALQFVPGSQSLVVFSESKPAKNAGIKTLMEVWNFKDKTSTKLSLPIIGTEGNFLLSENGQRVVVFSKELRRATVVDIATGRTVSRINLARNVPLGMLPGTDLLMLRTEGGGIQFWDTVLDQYRTELQVFDGEPVSEVVLSKDRKTLVILGIKGSLKLLGADRLRDELADVRQLMVRAPVFPNGKPEDLFQGSTVQQMLELSEIDPAQLPVIEILDEMPELPPGIQQPPVWEGREDDGDADIPSPPAPLPPAPVIDPDA